MSDYFNNLDTNNDRDNDADNKPQQNNESEHSNHDRNDNSYHNHDSGTPVLLPGGMFLATRICGMLSFTLGMLSVTACCLGYLSIPLGALGILFGILCRRQGEQLPPICRTGLAMSIAGLIIGICVFTLHLYTTITDPAFWEYTQDIWEMYGFTMTEL